VSHQHDLRAGQGTIKRFCPTYPSDSISATVARRNKAEIPKSSVAITLLAKASWCKSLPQQQKEAVGFTVINAFSEELFCHFVMQVVLKC